MDERLEPPSTLRKALGWAVHAYTGSGLILAAWITAILLQPDRSPDTYRACFVLMLAGILVDATDGALARAVRIKEAIPHFDGRRLDDLVDFLMYTCLPLLLIHRADLLPPNAQWVLVGALVASAYGFSQTDAKTANGAFRGFPSYWNIVAFYLYTLPIAGWPALVIVVGLVVLTFVPSLYPYPTQPGRMNRWMLVLSVPWFLLVLTVLFSSWRDGIPQEVIRASAVYPALYLAVSWASSLGRCLHRTAQTQPPNGRAG